MPAQKKTNTLFFAYNANGMRTKKVFVLHLSSISYTFSTSDSGNRLRVWPLAYLRFFRLINSKDKDEEEEEEEEEGE